MTTPQPNDVPRQLLAAYVDGELDAATRAKVEQWLATHPQALEDLQAQRDLSPANAAFWERAEPPEPSELAWANTRRAIEAHLDAPASPRRWRRGAWALVGLAAAGVAAAVAWIGFGPLKPSVPSREEHPVREQVRILDVAPQPHDMAWNPPAPREDPLAGLVVLPMATDEDVILDRVPEFPAGWLPVGRHPLQDALSLATEQELLVTELAPSSIWPGGKTRMTVSPGDAPMIYAARLR